MLTLYGTPRTRSDRALWALEESGLPYDFIFIDLFKGEGHRAEFLAINPAGKVPALRDDAVEGGLLLTESAAICSYIADQAGAVSLIPACGTVARARHDQWCYFAMTELEQPLWTMSKHQFALPQKYRVPAAVDTAKWEFAQAAKLLADALSDKAYIVGDNFTVADILLGSTLAWAKAFSVPLGHEVLDDYAQRLFARPAFVRVMQRH